MNWAAFWTIVSAIIVGGCTNELGDISPWLAKKMLRRAARNEATSPEEHALLLDELLLLLEEVPGKFSKLFWSIGRLGYSFRFSPAKIRRSFERLRDRVSDPNSSIARVAFNGIVLTTCGALLTTVADNTWIRLGGVVVTVIASAVAFLLHSWTNAKPSRRAGKRR